MQSVSKPFCYFSAFEIKQIQKIYLKHCLIIFITDKFDNWTGEYPQRPLFLGINFLSANITFVFLFYMDFLYILFFQDVSICYSVYSCKFVSSFMFIMSHVRLFHVIESVDLYPFVWPIGLFV